MPRQPGLAALDSEREIAHALFVTPTAVDFQLGDVYRKLGEGSRDELALVPAGERG
jgi:DNA-binding CsgD family transcriptional regulator